MASILDYLPLVGQITGYLGGGMIQANAATQAQKQQEKALNRAGEKYTAGYNEAKTYQQPYAESGQQDYQTMRQMVNNGQFNVDPYNYQAEQFNFKADPGYQARLQEGNRQIMGQAAAKGMVLSGASQKALQRYGQNFASAEVDNAYKRFDINRTYGAQNAWNQYSSRNQQATQGYSRMSDLAGYGERAGVNMSNLASQYGSNMAGIQESIGNVRSAGIMARGQAYGGTVSNLTQIAGDQIPQYAGGSNGYGGGTRLNGQGVQSVMNPAGMGSYYNPTPPPVPNSSYSSFPPLNMG